MKLFLTDLDGVWTDGTVRVHADGGESLAFHVHDGYAVRMLPSLGIEVAVISGRRNPAAEHRVRSLGVEAVFMGQLEKGPLAARLAAERGLAAREVAAMGDDLPDLGLFEAAGLCIAPPQAVEPVRSRAHYVTQAAGGCGALREACQILAAARGAGIFLRPGDAPGSAEAGS